MSEEETKVVDSEDNDTDEQGLPAEALAKAGPMAELMASAGTPPVIDDVVEGPVVAIGRARVFIVIFTINNLRFFF